MEQTDDMTHYDDKSKKELDAELEVPEGVVQGIATIVSEAKQRTAVHANGTLDMMEG